MAATSADDGDTPAAGGRTSKALLQSGQGRLLRRGGLARRARKPRPVGDGRGVGAVSCKPAAGRLGLRARGNGPRRRRRRGQQPGGRLRPDGTAGGQTSQPRRAAPGTFRVASALHPGHPGRRPGHSGRGTNGALVAGGLLAALFVATALLVAVASGDSPGRPARSVATDGWPACRSVPGRPIGCFTAPAPPATTATTSTTVRTPTGTAKPCRARDLKVRVEASQGLGGTAYTPLVFANRSSSACTLSGHPRVAFLDRSEWVIGQAAPTPLIDPPVTPGPGEVAVADLTVVSQDLGECRPVAPARIRVDVRDGDTVMVAPGGFRFCPGENAGIKQYRCPQLGCDRDHG